MNDEVWGFLTITTIWLGSLVAVAIGMHGCRDMHWKEAAVQHGAADYDPQTGNWRWKNEASYQGGHGSSTSGAAATRP